VNHGIRKHNVNLVNPATQTKCESWNPKTQRESCESKNTKNKVNHVNQKTQNTV